MKKTKFTLITYDPKTLQKKTVIKMIRYGIEVNKELKEALKKN